MIRLWSCLWIAVLALIPVVEENWPEFRGPKADGYSKATGLPLNWSETRNVVWKTPIHGRGWSSPVVWGKQVWLTTATPDGREMFVVCVDRATGKVLLDRKLFENPTPEPINDFNSYASPSPVIEEGRVYVHFGRYGTACVDTKTFQTLWERRDLVCEHQVGPGSSPVLYGDLVILTLDGMDVQFTIGLNKRSGVTVWKKDREMEWGTLPKDERKAFCTPVVTAVNGQPQLISPGPQAVFAYDPRDGKTLWKVRYHGFSNAARPAVGTGMVYISTGYNRADLWAVRLDGQGDVTDTHVAWKYAKNVPLKPSMLVVDDLIYLPGDGGLVTCLDAKTGEEIWKERIGGALSASPLYAEGRLYFFNEQGKTAVLKPGRTFDILAENTLDGGFMASPAVAGKALYLRTKTHLYRVEQ